MAKKIKNAIRKMGDWILNAWDVSKKYIAGSIFALVLFVAISASTTLFANQIDSLEIKDENLSGKKEIIKLEFLFLILEKIFQKKMDS